MSAEILTCLAGLALAAIGGAVTFARAITSMGGFADAIEGRD